MILPKTLGLIFIFFVFLLLGTKFAFAAAVGSPIYLNDASELNNYIACDPSECAGADTQCANSQNVGNCGLPVCEGGNAWTKYNLAGCGKTSSRAECHPLYDPSGLAYSIGDKCVSGEAGLRSSNCTAQQSPSIYKTCCSNTTPSYVINDPRSGMGGANSCVPYCAETNADGSCRTDLNPPYEGYCPDGSTTKRCGDSGYPACGQEACGPLPPTCTQGTSYNQCGGTCNGVTYPSNHTISVTPSYCSDGSTTYSCTDTGVFPGQCGNPLTCSVSFSLSNSNPPSNSTVNVSVTGLSSDAGWSNVAYSLDGTAWNTGVNVPNPGTSNYTFNVNSDSAGLHSLRFAVNSGSVPVICSSSGVNSFSTQAPPQNNNASCGPYTVNNGNPVFTGYTVPVSISMTNSGDTTWTPSGSFPYRLGAQQPQDNSHWGTTSGADSGLGVRPTRRDLSYQVGPGSSFPFSFSATAPTTAGTYRLSWQMVKEGIEWFGGMCQKDVPVATPPPGGVPFTFTPSCTGTVTNTTTKTVRWDAIVDPATPPTGSYTYLWKVDASGTGSSVTQTYATAGIKNATVEVTSGTTTNPASCSVTITTPPPTVDIKAAVPGGTPSNGPITLSYNSSATLSWTTTQSPTSCTASATPSSTSWTGAKSTSGSNVSTGTLSGPQNYIYTLTCANAGGSGTDSVTVSVLGSNGAAPAAVPGAFSQTASSPTAGCSGTSPYVDLWWTQSTNAQSYSVFRNSSSITDLFSSTQFFRDLNVAPSTAYSYLIRAVNTAGSTDSDTKSVTTLNCSSSTPSSGCAWIQTTGGDVHSNTGINTPCGP